MSKRGTLAALAETGAEFRVRVTPNASRAEVTDLGDGQLKVAVTATPEGGKANAAVRDALARALGVAKTRLELTRGATSRDKVFRLD